MVKKKIFSRRKSKSKFIIIAVSIVALVVLLFLLSKIFNGATGYVLYSPSPTPTAYGLTMSTCLSKYASRITQDIDKNGVKDICQDLAMQKPSDKDNDGVADKYDNCVNVWNPKQENRC